MIKRIKTTLSPLLLMCLAQMSCVSLWAMSDVEDGWSEDQFGNLDGVSSDAVPSFFWLLASTGATDASKDDDLVSVGWGSDYEDNVYDDNGSDDGYQIEDNIHGLLGLSPGTRIGLRSAFDHNDRNQIKSQGYDSNCKSNTSFDVEAPADADTSKNGHIEQDDKNSWLTNPVPYCLLAAVGVMYYYRHSIAQWFGFSDDKKKIEEQPIEGDASDLADNVVENR